MSYAKQDKEKDKKGGVLKRSQSRGNLDYYEKPLKKIKRKINENLNMDVNTLTILKNRRHYYIPKGGLSDLYIASKVKKKHFKEF